MSSSFLMKFSKSIIPLDKPNPVTCEKALKIKSLIERYFGKNNNVLSKGQEAIILDTGKKNKKDNI